MDKEASFKNIDEYLDLQEPEVRKKLEHLRNLISSSVPSATEVISYQMPAYKHYGMLAFFASFSNHYSLFLRPATLDQFRSRLKEYKLTKSAINIPKDKQLPDQLVREMITRAAEINESESELKKLAKKAKKVS